MIVSNDSIMQPSYEITNKILKLLIAISGKLGEVNAIYLNKPSLDLKNAVDQKKMKKIGNKRTTTYKILKK